MSKSNENTILTRLLRKLRNSPTSTKLEGLNLKEIKKEKDKLKKEQKETKLKIEKIEELLLQETLKNLDPNFDKKLECLLKTPPLKLKDLKEQLKKEREGKQDSH